MFARLLWRRGTRGQYTSSIIPTYFQLQLYTSMYYLSRRDAFKFASRFHDIAYPYGIVYMRVQADSVGVRQHRCIPQ